MKPPITMTRARWTVEMDGARARVTFTPEQDPRMRDSLREWYGRPDDSEASVPITMIWNGDDLSDLEIAIREAREAADGAMWEGIEATIERRADE